MSLEICGFSHALNPPVTMPTLMTIWDRNVGIGVDVPVHHITNKPKWHKPPTKTPEETR